MRRGILCAAPRTENQGAFLDLSTISPPNHDAPGQTVTIVQASWAEHLLVGLGLLVRVVTCGLSPALPLTFWWQG